MTIEIITVQDLEQFKKELLCEISDLLTKNVLPSKKWLRSIEVRKMLSISPGTLQNLRIQGSLKYSKVGGTFYYDAEDIKQMMSQDSTF